MLTPIRFPFVAAALLLAFSFSAVTLVARPAPGRLQQNARDFDSLASSAASARESGHAADAISLYQQALGLRPDWAEGWWYLGTLLYDSDRFPGALAAFQKLAVLAPGAPGAFSFLGLCEFETGDYDSALEHLQRGSAADAQDDPQLTRVVSFHLALLLILVVAFTVLIGVLTALDMIHHGVNWLDVLAILIVVLFGTGIVGALLHPPRR